MTFFRGVRFGSWALLMLCFVLPFAKGCNDRVDVPYQYAFADPGGFLVYGLPFLYPLLFVGVALLAWRLEQPARRQGLFQALYLGSFGALTALLVRWHVTFLGKTLDWPDYELMLFLGLLVVWASMGVRADRLVAEEIPSRLAVQWSVAAWMLVGMLFWLADRLLGAWLAFAASTTVVLSYAGESVRRRLNERSEAVRSHG